MLNSPYFLLRPVVFSFPCETRLFYGILYHFITVLSSVYSKTARTLRHRTEACRRFTLYVQLSAQYRAVFEGEVHDTIGIHRHLLHHSIPQCRPELDHLLIAAHQMFYKGCEHFALSDHSAVFTVEGSSEDIFL